MCEYILTDDNANAWECSECREVWILNDGTPIDNRMNYCPFCGSKITGIRDEESLEEMIEYID